MATNRMEDDGKTKTLILWDIGTFVMSENPLYLSDLKTTRKFFPGIIDLFQQFHDQCRMVIISTYLSKDEVNSLLQFNQIQQYFYDVYCSDDHLSDEEENLNIFEFILKKGQIQKADCIYITNSGNSVHEITKEMGIYSIGVAWELATSEALQDHIPEIVHSVDELSQAIRSFSSKTQRRRRKSRSKSVSWQEDVIDNEGMGKLRTDDEYWDPSNR